MKKDILKNQFSHNKYIKYTHTYIILQIFFTWENYCFNDKVLRKLDEMSKLNEFEIQRIQLNKNKISKLN